RSVRLGRRAEIAAVPEALVGSLEDAPDRLAVRRLLGKALRIPLAARRREEVAAVDVDASGEPLERVRDRVDRGVRERRDVALEQAVGAAGLQAALGPLPEDVVLAARVDADQRPHPVVVWLEVELWRPRGGEDRQRRRAVEHGEPGPGRLA